MPDKTYRIGTRGSRLALWQAEQVAKLLEQKARVATRIEVISTRGDRDMNLSLSSSSLSKGLFTEELEERLRTHEIDFAVHSLKDLPVLPSPGLTLGGTLLRGPVRDVIVSREPISSIWELQGVHVGTSSPRRQAQLEALFEGSKYPPRFSAVRGNVETRIKKLYTGEYDALLLAQAGLVRLGLDRYISCYPPQTLILPAPGQGAIAIQCAQDNGEALRLARLINDPNTMMATTIERELLRLIGGGCAQPLGCLVWVHQTSFRGDAFYSSAPGQYRRVAFGGSTEKYLSTLEKVLSHLLVI